MLQNSLKKKQPHVQFKQEGACRSISPGSQLPRAAVRALADGDAVRLNTPVKLHHGQLATRISTAGQLAHAAAGMGPSHAHQPLPPSVRWHAMCTVNTHVYGDTFSYT